MAAARDPLTRQAAPPSLCERCPGARPMPLIFQFSIIALRVHKAEMVPCFSYSLFKKSGLFFLLFQAAGGSVKEPVSQTIKTIE